MRYLPIVALFGVGFALFITAILVRADADAPGNNCETPIVNSTVESTPVHSSPATDSAILFTGLDILAADDDFPRLVRTLAVQVSANRPEVAELIRRSPADLATPVPGFPPRLETLPNRNAYRDVLFKLLTPALLDEPTTNQLLDGMTEPPTISVGGSVATITFPVLSDVRIFGYGSDLARHVAVPWTVRTSGRHLEFGVNGPPESAAAWHLWVCVDGMEIEGTGPLPEISDGTGHLSWTVDAEGTGQETRSISVRVKPTPQTVARLWAFSGQRKYVAYAWTYLVPLLVVVGALMLVPWTNPPSDEFRDARERLRLTALAVLRLGTAGALAFLILAVRSSTLTPSGRDALWTVAVKSVAIAVFQVGWHPRGIGWHLVGAATLGFGFLIAVGWVIVYARWLDLNWGFTWDMIRRVLLAVGYATFLATAVSVWLHGNDQTIGRKLAIALTINGAIGVIICTPGIDSRLGGLKLLPTEFNLNLSLGELSSPPLRDLIEDEFVHAALAAFIPLWVTGCSIAGMTLLASALLPAGVRSRFTREQWRLLVIPVAIAAGLLVVGQWGWAVYLGQNLWWRAPFAAAPRSYLWEFYSSNGVRQAFLQFPLAFLGPVAGLLLLLPVAGLIGMLRGAAESGSSLAGAEGRWLRWALVLLFAVFVVGYGGEVIGYRLPLAFLFSLLLARLAICADAACLASAVGNNDRKLRSDDETSGEPRIFAQRRALLQRAKDTIDLSRQRATVYQQYAEGRLSHRVYLQEGEKLHGAIERLEHDPIGDDQTPAPEGLPGRGFTLPAGVTPHGLALATGPGAGWWENGVRAFRLSWPLAALPIAYFFYVLITGRARGDITSTAPFEAVDLITGVVAEIVFWLVSAFVFGALFGHLRGQNGPWKGAVLTLLVYTAPHLASALILGRSGDDLWLVRSFQLLLFLVLLGIRMDLATIEEEGYFWRILLEFYGASRVSLLVKYLAPLIAATVVILQQLSSGQARDAISSIIETLPKALPPLS